MNLAVLCGDFRTIFFFLLRKTNKQAKLIDTKQVSANFLLAQYICMMDQKMKVIGIRNFMIQNLPCEMDLP